MDAETRKKIEEINEGLNREDREALNAFITTCFDLNDTLQDYQATWANYGFRTACNYFRMEVLETMREREAELVEIVRSAILELQLKNHWASAEALKRRIAEHHAAKPSGAETRSDVTGESCPKCGSTDFAVARDMIGTRHCVRCHATWLPGAKGEG